MKRLRRVLYASLIITFVYLGSVAVATAQAEVFTEPFSLTLTPADYPCLEEDILIDGTLHFVEYLTFDASGGRHRATLVNAQGLTGEGLTSGTVYRVSGPGHSYFNDGDLTAPVRERTFYDIIHVVGPGDAIKLMVRVGFHLTYNSDGELVAFTQVDSVKCQ